MENNKKIGMVLSGGGVRGAAHAGLLKALVENDIQPDFISGSSAGAVVGTLFAADYDLEAIKDFFKNNSNVLRWQNFARRKPGLLDPEKYLNIFEPLLKEFTFETLARKMTICVTDVLDGQYQFFSSGKLIRPLLASGAFPGVFSPVEIDGRWYIDGGTMNNFPIEALVNDTDFIIGSFVSPRKPMNKKDISNTFKLLNRANDLALYAGSQSKFWMCDFLFSPPDLWKYSMFDSTKAEEIFEIGYTFGLEKMPELLELINAEQSDSLNKRPYFGL